MKRPEFIDWDAMRHLTMQQIADGLGVSRMTVHRWMRLDGVTHRLQPAAGHSLSAYMHGRCKCGVCTSAGRRYNMRRGVA